MEICDFCSVMRIIRDYISDSRAISQTDLLYEIFATFMADDDNADYDFDNALVCRWFNGQAGVTPRISRYYQENKMESVLITDVRNNLISLFYDGFMCVEKIHDLMMMDDTVSSMVKNHVFEEYPVSAESQMASVIGKVIYFILQRKFIKRGSDAELAITEGRMSPAIATYIIGCTPPAPCRHFVGREHDIEKIKESFEKESKVFLRGTPGMGKSETAKAFAKKIQERIHESDLYHVLREP